MDHGDDMDVWEEFGLFAWELWDWRSLQRCTNRLNNAGVDNLNTRLFTAVRGAGDLEKATKVALRDARDPSTSHPIATASVHMRRGENEEAAKAWKVAVKSAEGSDGGSKTGTRATPIKPNPSQYLSERTMKTLSPWHLGSRRQPQSPSWRPPWSQDGAVSPIDRADRTMLATASPRRSGRSSWSAASFTARAGEAVIIFRSSR